MTLRLVHLNLRFAVLLGILLASGQFSRAQTPRAGQPVLSLYRKLQSVGLDPQRIYKIREAAIDREDIHPS